MSAADVKLDHLGVGTTRSIQLIFGLVPVVLLLHQLVANFLHSVLLAFVELSNFFLVVLNLFVDFDNFCHLLVDKLFLKRLKLIGKGLLHGCHDSVQLLLELLREVCDLVNMYFIEFDVYNRIKRIYYGVVSFLSPGGALRANRCHKFSQLKYY